MTSIGHFAGGLWRNLRVVKICGANTDVGKTVVAAGLARACLKKQAGENVYYIKPVAAGPSATTDHRCVCGACVMLL